METKSVKKSVLSILLGIAIILGIWQTSTTITSITEDPKKQKENIEDDILQQLSIKVFCLEGQEYYFIKNYVSNNLGFTIVPRLENTGRPKKCKKENGNGK